MNSFLLNEKMGNQKANKNVAFDFMLAEKKNLTWN